jgi:cation diffusion facilitator CzcD-associated flavoprotein CzcO
MAGEPVDAVVVGGGPFGLGAAGELERRGVKTVVLERAEGVGASWVRRYDGLRLNSVRWMSGLPGAPIPRSAGRWPTKEDLVAHLERYAEQCGLDVRLGVEVERVERHGGGYRVETSAGPFTAGAVVVATGFDRVPTMPDWPGREGFEGELIHGSEYRNPIPFRDRDVLVVGAGNTGTEIAVQLADAGAAKVRMAVRTPPNLVAIETLGLPATPFGELADRLPARLVDFATPLFVRDLSKYGLGRSPYGLATEIRVKRLGVVVDRGIGEALRSGRVEVVPAVERFHGCEVVLAGGARLRPDAVIAATGYRMGLEPLVGHLGVLDPHGRPAVLGAATHPSAPRLYFNGYYQPIVGQLPQLRRSSRAIGRAEAAATRRRRRCSRGLLRPHQASVGHLGG